MTLFTTTTTTDGFIRNELFIYEFDLIATILFIDNEFMIDNDFMIIDDFIDTNHLYIYRERDLYLYIFIYIRIYI